MSPLTILQKAPLRAFLPLLLWLTPAVVAVAGETPAEKLDLIRRIVSERGEYDLAERQLKTFIDENRDTPAAAEALVLLGYSQDKLKKNADAAASYRRLLDDYPSAPAELRADAALGAADAWFRLGNYREAIQDYSTVIRLGGKAEQGEAALLWRGEARHRLALEEQDAGRDAAAPLREAAADFSAFIEQYPDSKLLPSALSGAGFAFFDAGEYARAAESFQRFAREFPADGRAEESRYYAAEALYRLKRYDEAKAAFGDIRAANPGGDFAADARAGAAWAEYSLGNVAAAAAGFEEAADLAGDDRERALSFLYDAGCAWREAGDPQKAAKPFLEVAKAADHELNSLAWFRLGTLWQEQAKAARERAERSPTAEDREKFAAMQKKLGEDAAQYFRRAIAGGKLGDEEIEARSLLGEVLLDAGNNDAAAAAFEEIASRWPESERAPWALYHQALAERELSRLAKTERDANDHLALAAAALEKSLAYPDAKTRLQAAWALADYQNRLGRTREAREQYRWLAGEGEGWARAWRNPQGREDPVLENRAREYASDSLFRLGESYYFANDYPRAAGFYQEVAGKFQNTPQAAMSLLRLGEIAENGKDPAAARARYVEALTLGMQLGKSRVGATVGYAQLRLGALLLRAGQNDADQAARPALLREAARNLSAVLSDPPEGLSLARPYYYLAEARYSLGQKQEALADYQKSLDADGGGDLADAAWFGMAWAKRDLGDAAGAVQAAMKVVDDFPDSAMRPDAFALLASLRRAQGDPAGAVRDLDRFLAEYPDNPLAAKALLERASALDELGRHDEAAEAFRTFLSRNPQHPDVPQALYQRSLALWNRIKPKAMRAREAEERLRELTGGGTAADAPAADRAEAEKLEAEAKALTEEARKSEDEILSSLRDLAERYPDYPVLDAAWLRVGEILYDRGDFAAALAAYQKALAASGAGSGGMADKAQYRMAWSVQRLAEAAEADSMADSAPERREAARKDMWDKRIAAIDAFESLIGSYPRSDLVGDACFRAAELRRRSGQDNTDAAKRSAWFESAGERYRQALEKGGPSAPYRAAAECGDGLCLLYDGKNSEAREVFRKILLGNPDGPYVQEAYWGLGQANLNLGAYADAAAAFEQALAADKGTETAAKSRFGLGMTAVMAGDPAKARMEFLGVDLYYHNYPEWAAAALVRAARTAMDEGMRDKAIDDLEKVLAKYGDAPAAEEARALQAQIMGGR